MSDARPGLAGLVKALVPIASATQLYAPPVGPTAPQVLEATAKRLLYKFDKCIEWGGEPQAMCMAFLGGPQETLARSIL